MIERILLAACLASFVSACQSVRQNGRSQFIVVWESQERQLGDQAYRDILKQSRLAATGKRSFAGLVNVLGR